MFEHDLTCAKITKKEIISLTKLVKHFQSWLLETTKLINKHCLQILVSMSRLDHIIVSMITKYFLMFSMCLVLH